MVRRQRDGLGGRGAVEEHPVAAVLTVDDVAASPGSQRKTSLPSPREAASLALPPSTVSLPAPPWKVSSPSPPSSESSPRPPAIVVGTESVNAPLASSIRTASSPLPILT